jgi:hypothetical protein
MHGATIQCLGGHQLGSVAHGGVWVLRSLSLVHCISASEPNIYFRAIKFVVGTDRLDTCGVTSMTTTPPDATDAQKLGPAKLTGVKATTQTSRLCGRLLSWLA